MGTTAAGVCCWGWVSRRGKSWGPTPHTVTASTSLFVLPDIGPPASEPLLSRRGNAGTKASCAPRRGGIGGGGKKRITACWALRCQAGCRAPLPGWQRVGASRAVGSSSPWLSWPLFPRPWASPRRVGWKGLYQNWYSKAGATVFSCPDHDPVPVPGYSCF